MAPLICRYIGLSLLAVAFIVLLIDADHYFDTKTLRLTSINDLLKYILVTKLFVPMHDIISRPISPMLISNAIIPFAQLPASLFLFGWGILTLKFGQRPRSGTGFSSH